jgi:hypothetical protein
MTLQFDYEIENEQLDTEKFFEEEGYLPFNPKSKTQMKAMMQEVCDKLSITDEYLVKKLEVVLKYDLPFFAKTRNLARNWVVENFIF